MRRSAIKSKCDFTKNSDFWAFFRAFCDYSKLYLLFRQKKPFREVRKKAFYVL